MKSKKGFTLIELLAVIVILAIIALIATPIIIGVIDNARKKAFENTAYGVLEGLRLNYTERILTGTTSVPQEFTFPNSGLKLSGEEPAYGSAKIDGKGGISFALADKDKKWCAKKEADSEKVTMEDYSEDNCKIGGTSGGGEVTPPESFATDSWETIEANVKAGNLSKYKVGDEKEVTLTGDYAGTYTVRIANTSKPAECDGADFSQTACGFVIEFKDIIANEKMNSTATNLGGYPNCELYKKLNPGIDGSTAESKIYNALPEELKNIIIYTKVISSHGSSDVNNFESSDKLYLLSTKEIWGKKGTSNQIDYDTSEPYTRQLDYYDLNGVTTSNFSKASKTYNGSNYYWWLRTASSAYNNTFSDVYNNGANSNFTAYNPAGVSPAFRIGQKLM